MDASARGDGLNMHMPPRDQRKRAPSAEPPGSTATRGRGGEGRKKAKPEWPPVEPGQEYEYVFTGIESAIAQTYTPEIMLRLKGQKVKALCENNAEGTGKLAISISGGPSGANAVNFVRSAASWWLRTNGTPDKGKGQQLGLASFFRKTDQSASSGVHLCSLISRTCAWFQGCLIDSVGCCQEKENNHPLRRRQL
jgi:hypothetical protein